MAWRCGGSSNQELVDNLFRHNLIKSPQVRDAMAKVDRANYCPEPLYAYEDSPQSIGHRATISAPHMHAEACESLLPVIAASAAPRILDIGSGSGYLTHVLANLAGPAGKVIGIEHIRPLVELGRSNTARSNQGRDFLESGRIKYVLGDGRKGWREDGGQEKGWDAIHVGAAALELHQELIDQLNSPGRHVMRTLVIPLEADRGRMFIPVSEPNDFDTQYIWVIDKDAQGELKRKRTLGVRYVPLTDPH